MQTHLQVSFTSTDDIENALLELYAWPDPTVAKPNHHLDLDQFAADSGPSETAPERQRHYYRVEWYRLPYQSLNAGEGAVCHEKPLDQASPGGFTVVLSNGIVR